jgi:hypothetical protein
MRLPYEQTLQRQVLHPNRHICPQRGQGRYIVWDVSRL